MPWLINIIIILFGIGFIAWALTSHRYEQLGYMVIGLMIIALGAISSLTKWLLG